MKNIVLVLFVFVSAGTFAQTKKDSWELFAKTRFEPKYYEKLGEYLFYPTFPADLKSLEGKEIVVEGFYVPFAPDGEKYIIISKFPMSQCYFCGGGGPESIAEVYFIKDPPKFHVDDLITVKGKLKLNADDVDHVNFILKDAVIVNK